MCILKTGSLGSPRLSRSVPGCVATPECSDSNTTSNSQSFSFSSCSSPVVTSISPNQGTYHDTIVIQGSGFSNITCSTEVCWFPCLACVSSIEIFDAHYHILDSAVSLASLALLCIVTGHDWKHIMPCHQQHLHYDSVSPQP